jgi:hypothetical protein
VLHGVLLIEHHADEQGERGLGQNLVGDLVASDVDGRLRGHGSILPQPAIRISRRP